MVEGAAVWSFVGYLVLVVAIGVWSTRFSSAGMGEYFLAGRSLNRWVVALSAVVSGRSSWLVLGLSGLAWSIGASAVWSAVGYVTVEFLLFWSYAGRLRRFSEAHGCITLPDFFAARFGDRSRVLRCLLVVVLLIFIPTYVAAQFRAGGLTFASAFGLELRQGVYVTAGIVLVYTVLGGFLAVSLTDTLQAVFMIMALVVVPIVAILDFDGGWAGIAARLSPAQLDPLAIGAGALIGALGIGLGSPGNPHILVRYMSIRDPAQLRASAVVGTVWNAVMALGAVMVGLVGRAYFSSLEALPLADKENVYVALASDHTHPVLFGVVLASVFAAIMSTTDSQLLVAASSVVRDLYEQVVRRGSATDPRRLVAASRGVVVVLVALSVYLGLEHEDAIYWFVLLAWAGLGAALGPTSILALYWSRTTRPGVIAGILTGAASVFLWRRYLKQDWWNLYELVPAFALGFAVTVVVSLLTAPPENADEMAREMLTSRTPER